MIKKILFFIGAAIFVIVVVFFVKNNSGKNGGSTILPKPQQKEYTPPVYVTEDSPDKLTRPLYLQGISNIGKVVLSSAQQKEVSDFKRKILTRVSSSMLGEDEKTIISICVSTTPKPKIGSMIVADQTVFNFSKDELDLISDALKK